MKKSLQFVTKLFLIFLSTGVLFSYAMFQGGFVSWFLFFGALPILIYMALLLIYPISRLKLERRISQNIVEAGNSIKVEIRFKRDSFFPLYYCIIEDIMPDSMDWRDTKYSKYNFLSKPSMLKEKQGAKKVIFPWFKSTFSFEYRLKDIPRGEHLIQNIRVSTGDFTGLIRKDYVFQVESKLFVYPAERKLTLRKNAESFEEGAASSFNRTLKNTTVVSGVREYAPGDRVSWIDWKASARKNTMMTKEFEQEKSFDMLVLFDGTLHEKMNWLAFEGSVEVGLSLVKALRDDSARLIFSSLGAERRVFTLNQDHLSKEKIRNHLTKITPLPSLPFSQMIKQEVGKLPQGFLFMVVTTSLSVDLYETLLQLRQRSPRIVLFFVHAERAITSVERDWFKLLKNNGIIVNQLTEEKLTKQSFEVNA
ncbi:uncharacterized protein (DUF58 family) [Salirhabdus euzebyi]|uniref:Uncharacterized protein (DUF58 family) n=1 Tax=Salirhabdus euzebyi TaxID=394506 RepID=A0A841Q8Y9_9BACI|nr:DUF58 domain-containing protein [Salirhabdus euzebyi]MBB6454878.1 uncharacterized protein (DUF58 family) [Salirhabdus euzebyi]